MAYFAEETIEEAVRHLHASAGHMLKLWLVLKRMGLSSGGAAVEIDTSNSTDALKELFGSGSSDGSYFVPFAHSQRFKEMKHDAARSIIQTNIRRWASSDSVVGCNPTRFLSIDESPSGRLLVKCSDNYPMGLGFGGDGFAIADDQVVRIPWKSWVIWYLRQRDLGNEENAFERAEKIVTDELHISSTEKQLLFVDDLIELKFQTTKISEQKLWRICQSALGITSNDSFIEIETTDFSKYSRKVRAMVPNLGQPMWLRPNPSKDLKSTLERGEVAILLYGPPRTGKTKLIDDLIARDDASRTTIQLHDGWSYDQLVQGILPTADGGWEWQNGPLLEAIKNGKKYIVLEEANRTSLVQALGEIFSLLELRYRGRENAITLRNGEKLWIEPDVVIILTANTIDKSTEDLDDALIGRLSAIECPPSSSDLSAMLSSKGLEGEHLQHLVEIFTAIQEIYPLGHGYFADVNSNSTSAAIRDIYKTRIRPVIFNYLGSVGANALDPIDVLVDTRVNW